MHGHFERFFWTFMDSVETMDILCPWISFVVSWDIHGRESILHQTEFHGLEKLSMFSCLFRRCGTCLQFLPPECALVVFWLFLWFHWSSQRRERLWLANEICPWNERKLFILSTNSRNNVVRHASWCAFWTPFRHFFLGLRSAALSDIWVISDRIRVVCRREARRWPGRERWVICCWTLLSACYF